MTTIAMLVPLLVLQSQSRGAQIKLPAGAEITNYSSGSFLFVKDLKKFCRKKVMVAEEVLAILIVLR
jgi:hypothetical protein